MANNQNIQDPSTQGVGGLKGVSVEETLIQQGLIKPTPTISSRGDYIKVADEAAKYAVPQEVGFAGINDSYLDEDITSMTQLDNLDNTRGELQPWYMQIGAGLAKGTVLAGTTFADGLIGTIIGIGNAAATGSFSGFWDNPFSNAMQQINEWSEKALPNYYTDAEKNEPWYENIFTANFLGDKFIKNLGFAVGAAYSGRVNAGALSKVMGLNKARQAFKGAVTASGEALNPTQALNAYREGNLFLDGVKLTEELARDAKKLKMAEPTLKLTGAFSGALGEARIEAINNSKDWFELHKQQLDDHKAKIELEEQEKLLKEFPSLGTVQVDENGNFIQALSPEGQALLEQRVRSRFNYEGGLQKLSEDRAKLGNIDFILNVPLLTISDAWQFGKFYAGGYNTAKRAGNIVKNVAEDGTITYSASKPSTFRNIVKMASKGVAEGPYEEMGQAVAGKVAGYKYASELNDFYGAKIDPEAEEETIDWLQATAKAISQTYGTAEGWEEGFIGGLTGLVGIPGFRSVKNSEGGLQSPVYLQGGIKEDIDEIRKRNEEAEEIVTQLNNRVSSPEFLNYYQSAIRHNKYQRDMDEAAENGDNFEFKNAEHNQLINDVIMFDKAGRIQDLYDIIEEAGTVKPEDVEQIRQLTTNKETGKSVYDGKTDEEVISQIQKQAKETKEAVDKYREISQNLQIKIGDYFDEDGLEEMTYYMSNIDNLETRFKELLNKVREPLKTIAAEVERRDSSEKGKKTVENIRTITSLNPTDMALVLNDEKNKEIVEALDINAKLVTLKYPSLANTGLADDIKDLGKIAKRRLDFIDKYNNYINNPAALKAKQDKQREKVIKDKEDKEKKAAKDAAIAATNLSEFRKALDKEADITKRQELLDELEKEGNQMAKDYKEVQMYNSEVSRAINNDSDSSAEVKADALKLLNNQHLNANNLKEIANPNSIFVTNPETLYDESLTDDENTNKFLEAQYALLKAMNKVNNDQRFKARFPSEYLKPAEKGKPNPNAPKKDSTGDSGTSTVPSVNIDNNLPTESYEPPVGNITSQMVQEENRKQNEVAATPKSLDDKQKGKRPYYRPSIPELHIEASKEGDFRPFNVVAAEREKGVNFDDLYNYLRDNGAFTYVNEGNLKAGDELGFMIDPAFNDHTIFIVDRRNNQIVGSLDESQYSVDRYEGLAGLEEKIRSEYSSKGESLPKSYFKNPDNFELIVDKKIANNFDALKPLYDEYKKGTISEEEFKQRAGGAKNNIIPFFENFYNRVGGKSKFIATPTTRVSQVMVGRIPYGTEERNLGNVSGVDNSSIFGIVKNGTLSTNGKLDDSLVIKPVDMSQKEGRMYLLIPNAAGKYSPAAVRVKHFNETEFNPDDVQVNSTQVYKNIDAAINQLGNSLSEEDVSNAVRELGRSLYLGDVHIDFIQGKNGTGIRFTKVQRDANGNEIYETVEGKRVRKEDVKNVFLTERWDPNTLYEIGSEGVVSQPTSRSSEDIHNEIRNILLSFNLPIQVNLGMLNKGNYNNLLLSSGVLTSNITEATVKSNWFTTDYFDAAGNLQKAANLPSVKPETGRKIETPVGGTESAIPGVPILLGNKKGNASVFVDLTSNTIRNDLGRDITPFLSVEDKQKYFDLAWAQNNFGDATNSSVMVDNKVLTPNGEILDRSSQKYLTGKEAQEVKDKIAGRKKNTEDSNKVIAQIAENQKRVDKERTDGEFYYILEDDGQYHEYERVHSRLGSNWVESKKQTEALRDIRVKLSQLADNMSQYNNYLKYLSNYWKTDLSAFSGKVDTRSRDTIVNTIRDSMNGTNSQRALNAGTAVDSVIRNFFTSSDMPIKPDNMTESAFVDLITSLNEIKSNIEARGERFLTNNVVLFQKYPDGSRVAGEVDILAIDSDGNFKIYDVKTSRYSFYDFVDRYGNKANYFKNKSNTQVMSSEGYYTLQLSAYKNLFESQYHTPITTLAILPFVLSYNKDMVEKVNKEKGILVTYNPAVNVPLNSNVSTPEVKATDSSKAVFNSTLETKNPVNETESAELKDSKIGYYIRDGKLVKSYLKSIGKVGDTEIYMSKVPVMTQGFGKEASHAVMNNFYAVFPNGESVELVKKAQLGFTEESAAESILKLLSGNPQKVSDLSSKETMIFNPKEVTPTVSTPVTPATLNQTQPQNGAMAAIQAEMDINQSDSDFDVEFELRQVDDLSRPLWDREKELEWLDKVLPNLNKEDRVIVTKGLIKVARTGALAWGQFSNGIITLSDIAAEGTTYHEAFHAVFNLLLDNNEKDIILQEARRTYGELDNKQLEEHLAEGFREYVITQDKQSLGDKIINFFKELLVKVLNWNTLQPHTISLYRNINEGYYSNSQFKVPPLSSSNTKPLPESFSMIDANTKEILEKKGWTEEKWNQISREEKEQALRCAGI